MKKILLITYLFFVAFDAFAQDYSLDQLPVKNSVDYNTSELLYILDNNIDKSISIPMLLLPTRIELADTAAALRAEFGSGGSGSTGDFWQYDPSSGSTVNTGVLSPINIDYGLHIGNRDVNSNYRFSVIGDSKFWGNIDIYASSVIQSTNRIKFKDFDFPDGIELRNIYHPYSRNMENAYTWETNGYWLDLLNGGTRFFQTGFFRTYINSEGVDIRSSLYGISINSNADLNLLGQGNSYLQAGTRLYFSSAYQPLITLEALYAGPDTLDVNQVNSAQANLTFSDGNNTTPVSLSDLVSGMENGISDAPADGSLYGRRNNAWQSWAYSWDGFFNGGYNNYKLYWQNTANQLSYGLEIGGDPYITYRLVPQANHTAAIYMQSNLYMRGATIYGNASDATSSLLSFADAENTTPVTLSQTLTDTGWTGYMGDVKAMEKYGTWSIDYGYNNYESFSILYNGTLQLNNNLYTNNRYIDGGTYDLQFKDAHNTGVTLSQLVASSGGTSTPDSVYQTLEGTVSVTTPKLIGGNLYGDTLFLNSGGYITQIDTGKISILDLKVTGTPSPTTFMRGDSTWAVPAGGGADSSFQKVLLDPLQNYGTGTGLWFGDGDAGIYESADDNLSLATSGVQAINIEPNGVHIYKNVGIGTNAGVSYPLEVRGRVQLVNGLPGGISIGGDVNGSTRSASTRKLAGIGSPDWSNTKTVEWLNFDSQGSTYNAVSFGGRIGGSAYAASSLIFVTAPNLSTTGGYNRMTITGAGNVGIGTSTPSAALQVAGQIIAGSYTVTPSATPGFNFHNGNTQQISVTANITSWTVTNALPAGSYTIYFKQDATGGRTIANLTGATKTANSLSFNTTANADNIVNIIVKPDGTIYWSVVEHVL